MPRTFSPFSDSERHVAAAVPAGNREMFVTSFVAERRDAWIRGNTSESPFGKSKPGEPSAGHIATWTDMANEAADQKGIKS
jgi:hypothetical protein